MYGNTYPYYFVKVILSERVSNGPFILIGFITTRKAIPNHSFPRRCFIKIKPEAPAGFTPTTSSLSDWRSNILSYGAIQTNITLST